MQLPSYEQELTGEFTANVIPRGQCGFVVGQQSFKFTVKVGVNNLDEHGFITDNKDLDKVISDAFDGGHWQASCEDLAGGIVNAVYKLAGVRAEYITAVVMPNDYAKLTCNWKRGDDLPVWVPKQITVAVA